MTAPLAECSVPVRTQTQLSGRTWRAHWGRAKEQRRKASAHLLALGWRVGSDLRHALKFGQVLAVTLTRVHPAGAVASNWKPADDDNLRKACKHVRDEVARWLAIDDGSPLIQWRYEQERGDWAVRVRVERAESEEA